MISCEYFVLDHSKTHGSKNTTILANIPLSCLDIDIERCTDIFQQLGSPKRNRVAHFRRLVAQVVQSSAKSDPFNFLSFFRLHIFPAFIDGNLVIFTRASPIFTYIRTYVAEGATAYLCTVFPLPRRRSRRSHSRSKSTQEFFVGLLVS